MATIRWHRLLHTRNDLTLTLARVALALVFLGHGSQKVFGWFGGLGFDGTLEMFQRTMGIPPALTVMAMTAEVLGGLGLLVESADAHRRSRGADRDARGAFSQRPLRAVLHELDRSQSGRRVRIPHLAIALILSVLVHGAGAGSLDGCSPAVSRRCRHRRHAPDPATTPDTRCASYS